MIVHYQGRGLLAFVGIFPVLASCAGLIDTEPKWICFLAIMLSMLIGAAICLYCGILWNRHRNEHSCYFLPLQYWGWVYLTLSCLMAVVFIMGAAKGLRPEERTVQAVIGITGLILTAGIGAIVPSLAKERVVQVDSEDHESS